MFKESSEHRDAVVSLPADGRGRALASKSARRCAIVVVAVALLGLLASDAYAGCTGKFLDDDGFWATNYTVTCALTLNRPDEPKDTEVWSHELWDNDLVWDDPLAATRKKVEPADWGHFGQGYQHTLRTKWAPVSNWTGNDWISKATEIGKQSLEGRAGDMSRYLLGTISTSFCLDATSDTVQTIHVYNDSLSTCYITHMSFAQHEWDFGSLPAHSPIAPGGSDTVRFPVTYGRHNYVVEADTCVGWYGELTGMEDELHSPVDLRSWGTIKGVYR
jgi:hypothetical protein